MSTVTKKSHSIDSALYAELVAVAAALGMSESAALAEGARLWLDKQRGLQAVREWEDEHGALTEAELAAADKVLDEIGVPRR